MPATTSLENDLGKNVMIKILGHRGYSSKFPENSIKAFKMAFYHNADGIECDLQKTKDNKFIVIHNDFVKIGNKKIRLSELTFRQLSGIKIKGEKVPAFDEMLKVVPEGKFLNLELKSDTITEGDLPLIYEKIRHLNRDNLMVSSFSHLLLSYFRDRGIKIGLLFGEEKIKMGFLGTLRVILDLRPDYFNIPYQSFDVIWKPLVFVILNVIRLFNKKIAFWVINESDKLARIIKYSDIIITDRVEYIKNHVLKN